jgi:crotonobetainyl-CoA:carnitine CoA-transferase CaiB-like acyl-CoA transferase
VSKLPHIEISIDGVTYDNTFQKDISVDQTNLQDEFVHHAERYAYYAFLSALARSKAATAKMEKEQVYARVDAEKRQAAGQVPGFKFTEKMAENEVITDPRYVDAHKRWIEATLLADLLEEASRAMSQRREMLVQFGGIARQQMSPQRVLEQQVPIVEQLISQSRTPSPPPMPPPLELSATASESEPAAEPTPPTSRRRRQAAQ